MLVLMNKLSDFCSLFSRNSPSCKHEVELLGKMATDIGFYWPLSFPTESVTYKMHCTNVHIPDYARRNAWLGRHGGMDTEQGVESLHKCIRRLYGWHKHKKDFDREGGMFGDAQVMMKLDSMALCDVKRRVCPACKLPNSKLQFKLHCVCIKTKKAQAATRAAQAEAAPPPSPASAAAQADAAVQ